MNRPENFNIRVYGLFHNPEQGLLVADEFRMGHRITKFPGGGLEFGEGLEEALKREWREEMELEIQLGQLLYVNEFFQASAFDTRDQILSIYYQVEVLQPELIPLSPQPFGYPKEVEGAISFRYLSPSQCKADVFTMPIDKVVAAHWAAGNFPGNVENT